jgi:hypothetical protein
MLTYYALPGLKITPQSAIFNWYLNNIILKATKINTAAKKSFTSILEVASGI